MNNLLLNADGIGCRNINKTAFIDREKISYASELRGVLIEKCISNKKYEGKIMI